jgi:hypothetical protein
VSMAKSHCLVAPRPTPAQPHSPLRRLPLPPPPPPKPRPERSWAHPVWASPAQEIASNAKLSENYLALARDLDVMEAKTPEDIYKSHLVEGRTPSGAATDSARQNLATTFVNAFVNAGYGHDKLMTAAADGDANQVCLRCPHHPVSPAGGTTAHSVLTSHTQPIPRCRGSSRTRTTARCPPRRRWAPCCCGTWTVGCRRSTSTCVCELSFNETATPVRKGYGSDCNSLTACTMVLRC